MPFSHTKFDDMQVAILQAAFDQSCRRLSILPSDKGGRDRVAAAIIVLAQTGQFGPTQLIAYATFEARDLTKPS